MVVSKGLKVPNSKKEDAPKKKRPRRKRALWRKHPKPEFPPQGGEARICLTLFLAMLMSVMSAVTMIYATVIVYKPAMKILRANLTGPKRCVTLSTQRNLKKSSCLDSESKLPWSSCEEWCLGVTYESCSHIHALVREDGPDIDMSSCENILDHTCGTLESLDELNCKVFSDQEDLSGKPGQKEECIGLDKGTLISCVAGVCKIVSRVYACEFRLVLEDISETEKCSGLGCWAICHRRNQCFDLRTRRDPAMIGTDEYGRPEMKFYTCDGGGRCGEVYGLDCGRRCEGIRVDSGESNAVVFSKERIVAAKCGTVFSKEGASVEARKGKLLVFECSEVKHSANDESLNGIDCHDGTWVGEKMIGRANYSDIKKIFHRQTSDAENLEGAIPSQRSLTISRSSRLRINLEGCVNTLSGECGDFFRMYGADGRNSTSRSTFPCYYDPDTGVSVIDYDRSKTMSLLAFFSAVPASAFVLSCAYIVFCNRMVRVSSDGRMRLRFCGRFVTGIGKVKGGIAEEKLHGS